MHSIDFIFGDAGSGKSEYIYRWLSDEAVKHPEKSFFLFVPEQNTLQAQKQLIEKSSRHGMLNMDVLSFSLLSYRTFEELGIESPVLIDDVSKSILLRKAVIEEADKLSIYRKKARSEGFLDQVMSFITEMLQYDIGISRLEEAAGKLDSLILKNKLKDICRIYAAFCARLEDKAALPEQIALRLLSVIEGSKLLEGSVIVFDGYTGFTPVQLMLIEHIISKAERTRFAVTVPRGASPYRRKSGDNNDITDIYWLSCETVAKICEAAERNSIRNTGEIYLDAGGQSAEAVLVSALNPAEEVRCIARDIRLRARTEGIRYRQMAVAAADLPGYAELLMSEFEHEEIPFFMDARAVAADSPSVQYILSLLSMIRNNYRFDDLMRYFRNPLSSFDDRSRNRIDLADNFLRKTGLRGRAALKAFGMEETAGRIFELEDSLKAAATIGEMTGVLRDFCIREELSERSEALAVSMEKAGYVTQAAECRRFTGMIPEMFDRMDAVLGEDRAGFEEFADLCCAGFRRMKGGMIPETMDCLVAGDIRRSRFDNIKVLYVIGANEGVLPSVVTGGGIFSDAERCELEAMNIEMAPDDRADASIQRFYLKQLFSKPSDKLILTFSRMGRDGKKLRASSVISEIEEGIYGSFDHVESIGEEDFERVSSAGDGLMTLAAAVSGASSRKNDIKAMYKALSRSGFAPAADRIIGASLSGQAISALSAETAEKLYGQVLKGSVTRIESFEGCPFLHFVRYGLGLKERERYEIGAIDIGTIFHSALDGVFRELRSKGTDIGSVDEQKLGQICVQQAEAAVGNYSGKDFDATARTRYIAEKIRRITVRTVMTLKHQIGAGDYSADATEAPFRISRDGVDLKGVIDRIDSCKTDTEQLVRVIDYKSANREFSIDRLLDGMELQLITYLNAAVRRAEAMEKKDIEVIPSGMFYYHIDDPVMDYDPEKGISDVQIGKLRELRMNGAVDSDIAAAVHTDRSLSGEAGLEKSALKTSSVINDKSTILSREDFKNLMRFAEERITEDAVKILSGNIEIKPFRDGDRSKCDYCAYHGICRFDPRIRGNEFRYPVKHDLGELRKEEKDDQLE